MFISKFESNICPSNSFCFSHYRIQRTRVELGCGLNITQQYYIDCQEREPNRFNNVESLIRYYSVYVQFGLNEDVEIFPPPIKAKKLQEQQLRRNKLQENSHDDGDVIKQQKKPSKRVPDDGRREVY